MIGLLQQIETMASRFSGWSPIFIRMTLGLVFMVHGLDKLFGCFGGGGFEATAKMFETGLGLTPGWFHAALGGGGELFGGFFIFTGLFTRFGGFLIAATMVVAIITAHLQNGLLARDNGFEYPLVCLGAALSLMFSGGLKGSLDRCCLFKTTAPEEPKTD